MSKRRRKKAVAPTPPKIKPSRLIKYRALIITIILAAIPFSMGKYIEFNSPGAFDSGAYVYSAKHVLEGAEMGVDEKPSAQAGTLLMNMLGVAIWGFDDIGPKIIQMLMQVIALVIMFLALRKIFNPFATSVSVIIAATYLSAPLIAKYGNVKEQYMICFMIIGMSLFALRVNGGAWWLAVLAGAALAWGPLFKQTGVSAIGAVGLYIVLAVIFKSRNFKAALADIGLMFLGAAVFLLPVYIWLIFFHNSYKLPYKFVWDMLPFANANRPVGGSYISKGRELSDFSTQARRVFSYYWLLRLPITIALASIVVWVYRTIKSIIKKSADVDKSSFDKFVPLFAVWWILDMAFVWISPRSYEQYYLPLNGSAAMLGGYAVAVYYRHFKAAAFKGKWVAVGFVGFAVAVWMVWHIFAGITKSPHSGTKYDRPSRGFLPKMEEVQARSKGARASWETVAEYIKKNSSEDDKIYVWGWVPGIYVKAGRLSSTSTPFTSEMHVKSPDALKQEIANILSEFEQEKPLFIIDTHKVHYPWNRPPLELWPRTPNGLLPNNPQYVASYESQYGQMLKEKVGNDEELRFEVMKAMRDFVMENYNPVSNVGQFYIYRLKER